MSNGNQTPTKRRAGKRRSKSKKNSKALVFGAIAMVLALIFVVYFTIASSYNDRFLSRTKIDGVDASGKTVDEVMTILNDQSRNYTLTLKERANEEESITGKDISLVFAEQADVQKLLDKVSPYTWLFSMFHDTKLTTAEGSLQFNENELKECLSNLRAFNPAYAQDPVDAKIVHGQTEFVIQKEDLGYKLKEDKVLKNVTQAIKDGDTELDLDKEGCYENPTIYSDDPKLKKELKKVNAFLKSEIVYDFDDRTIPVTHQDIMNMIVPDKNRSYVIKPELVYEFVKTKLAYKTDTFGLTHKVKTHSGKTVTLKGGDYGWCIDRKKTALDLMEYIKKGEKKKVEPYYLYKGKSRAKNDIGGTYVEISIADQTLWCYKNGKVAVESPVVTGNTSRGHGTPTGSVWAIDAKKSPAVLGTIATMGYSSPVKYWMPFTGNVGMHDADGWRSNYGGEIYKTNGSHGCVNMPLSKVREVYGIVEIGTAVVVY